MKYPFYTDKPQKPAKPVELPKSRQEIQTDPKGYIPDKGLMGAVNAALLLGQPLLLTGEPGTGKTQLAYSLAYQLGLVGLVNGVEKPLTLKFETKSTSVAPDLFYLYDAIGHFRAVQIDGKNVNAAGYLKPGALGEAIIHTNPKAQIKNFKIEEFLPRLDFPYTEPRRFVVLIDEIDKAPRDFPNDILNEIEQLYFRIPEFDNVKVEANKNLQPILVLTSNSEKHLPDAFLRRCIYYDIPFPDEGRLKAILAQRLEDYLELSDAFLKKGLEFFFILRNKDLRLNKSPATAELLNWFTLLRGKMFEGVDNPFIEKYQAQLSDSLTTLVKNRGDLETVQAELKEWLNS